MHFIFLNTGKVVDEWKNHAIIELVQKNTQTVVLCTIRNWREVRCYVKRNGIQQEIRKREHYEKPSVKRKKKSEAARKRKFN